MTENLPTIQARPPGSPSERVEALERLIEAMILVSTINRMAGEAFLFAFRVAWVAAPYGANGPATTAQLKALLTRLEQHIATLPKEDPRKH